MSETIAAAECAHCGKTVLPHDLACPACGYLTHAPQLSALSRQAQDLEQYDPPAAVQIWQQCLSLLPPDSPQADHLRRRIASLAPGQTIAPTTYTWKSAFIRTGGSMIVSMLVYSFFLGLHFAIGFVLLIWIHEMGHVIALRRYGVRSAPPLFLPFIGAVITIGRLRDAAQEAIVGIGGPVLGTVGALICFALYQTTHRPILLDLAFWGASMNLLNLLPIPPLDGGRVTAAISPWLWPLGLLAIVALMVLEFAAGGDNIRAVSPVLALILIFAAPRLWRTFRYRERNAPYYKIKKSTSWAIGIAYVLLGALLLALFVYTAELSGS